MCSQTGILRCASFLATVLSLATATNNQMTRQAAAEASPCLQVCTINNLPVLLDNEDLYYYKQSNATNYQSFLASEVTCDSYYYWGTLSTSEGFTYDGIPKRNPRQLQQHLKFYHFRNMKLVPKHANGHPALLYCELPAPDDENDGDENEAPLWKPAPAWPVSNKCSLSHSAKTGKWKPSCSLD